MNTARSLPPEPPARGSFPLDHGGLCKAFMRAYLACAKANAQAHHLCRDASKAYLQCRMEKNLMAPEDLNSLGFDPSISVVPGAEPADAGGEIIAGLAAAKRRNMGVLFGIGSDAKRGGGGH